jgi:anti-sigma regulatory factor (Ser/Thr protein kinase)
MAGKCLRVKGKSFDKVDMMNSRLTLGNRPENLKLVIAYVGKWAGDHGLSSERRRGLEQAAAEIFRHLVTRAYQPDQPGSIAISLEERGPRLRLTFEDDAAPHNPHRLPGTDEPGPTGAFLDDGLQQLAESLIYYRTADRKNRMVVFLT